MSIDIECVYAPQDFVRAQYLHIRPRRWLYILVAGVVGFWLILLMAATILAPAPTHEPHSQFTDMRTLLTAGFLLFWIAFLGSYFGLFIPRRARRIFTQTKGLQLPNRFSFGSEGMTAENANGKSAIPWNHFRKWRESQELFLLYPNDIMFYMIPKRCMVDEEQVASLHALLGSQITPS